MSAPRTQVAVTGAGGGLGRALVAELITRGHAVRAAVRNDGAEAIVARLGAVPFRADIRQPDTLAPLFEGADVVYHLAAWMGAPAGKATEVNVVGTRNVMAVAGASGVRRVVLASSIAVYGPVKSGHVSEDAPHRKVGDAYGDSKIDAEAAATAEVSRLAAVSGTAAPELVVLRPTMIYGPASASWTTVPVAGIARGLPIAIGDGSGLLDAVYVTDVARAFALAGEAQNVDGQAFNVTGARVTVDELFGAYADMLGKKLRHLPVGIARGGVGLAALVTGALPHVDRVAPETLDTLTSAATFDGSKAAALLGYVPSVSLSTGLGLTAAWLREAGLARGPRSALVVGAGTGLGREVVKRLAERYVRVYAADVAQEALESLAEEDERVAGIIVADATSSSSLGVAVARVEEMDGGIDLAVTTVGALLPGALESQSLADIERQFALNALAPVKVARAVAPGMRARGGGVIVMIGSTNGVLVTPFMGAYSAGKYALEAYSDALRLELKPFGVDVVLVRPGAMRTGFAARAKEGLEREAARTGEPWAGYLARLRGSDLWGESGAADAASVSRVVADVAWRRPRARVSATWDVPFVKLFAGLPDVIKDAHFTRVLGLRRPRRKRGAGS
ncbi:MAG TPA: SDR family NAD(P)-dependent oxidoreductase, partial [Trueperaceae bacterium]|nr:SDR family NAD(P)-dependent oxidoreductase [Trueperaceae bacterium]